MKTKFLLITLLLLSINNGMLISQPQKRLREIAATQEINQYFQDYYSGTYRVGDIVDIDSLKGDKKYLYKTIQNPYGMLTNSFVFVTDINIDYYEGMDGNRVGTYKEGNILWLSEPDFPGGGGGRIFAIDDINLDGTVEIITEWDYGVVSLEIYSWDGVSGKLLNSEPIIGKEFNMSFVDVEGDGILDIISVDRSQVTDVWSWNGSEYGKWTSTPSVSLTELYPANNFIPHVKCNVTKQDSIFTYSYTVKNDEQSKQRIELFWIKADVEENNLIKNSPPYWASSGYSNNLEGWETPVLNNGYLIWPGDLKEGFKFIINALPTIAVFAMQAYNSLPDYYLLSQQETITLMERDLSENMVWGKTIGPKDIHTSLIPSEFIDSLINYNQRSLELGWINNQYTTAKYDSLFTLAKTQLQQNNNNAARTTLQTVLQEVNIDSTDNLTSEAYALIKYNTEYLLQQIPEQPNNPNLLVNLKNSLGNQIPANNVQYYEGIWKDAVNNGDGTFTVITTKPKVSIRVYYEYASLQADNVNAQNNTYTFTTVNAAVQLKNSLGNLIDQGTVQYYAGAWRSFGTTTNGVAAKELLPINFSFRMTYEYASIDKQQNLSTDPTVVFQTVNSTVKLLNSQSALIDQGTVQYYAGAWRSFGTTSNGVANKELLPINYSFRMTYEYASIDRQQNLSSDPTVVFQTVNSTVKLLNSQNALIDQGTVQYYAGAWRSFGTTSNGVAYKELLPINYSFRMTYEYGSIDKQQNLSSDPTVVFQTVNSTVKLLNSQNALIDQGTVQYYAGAWRSFGTTTNGVAYKELLPINYSFRMTYEYVSKDKQQNLSTNPVVDFNTVLCSVKVSKTSNNQPINNATVKYYAGAWRNLGTTNIDGITTKELMPANLSFRASSGNVSFDKQQDISVNNLVEILLNVP